MGVEQGDQTAAKAAVIDRLVGTQGWRGAPRHSRGCSFGAQRVLRTARALMARV